MIRTNKEITGRHGRAGVFYRARRGAPAIGLIMLAMVVGWIGSSPSTVQATGGITVTSVDGDGAAGATPALSLDAAGNPIVAYRDVRNSTLKVLHCGDPTCTADNIITTPDAQYSEYMSMELDSVGRPVIAYLSVEEGGIPRLRVLRCGDASCGTGNTIVTIDSGGPVGEYPSLELDSSERPVVAFWNASTNALDVLFCGSPACTSGNSIATVDSDGGSSPSLVLATGDLPVVSYYDLFTGTLKVARCGTSTCSSSNVISDAGPVDPYGTPSSIKLDALDRPVVSYDTGAVSLLHCGTPNCGAGNTKTSPTYSVAKVTSLQLDAAGNPVVALDGGRLLHCDDPNCAGSESSNISQLISGFSPSLALDATGNPVIASYSAPGIFPGTLQVTHCNDPMCTGGDETLALPDPARNVGAGSSLALDVSGNPVISYADHTFADLKLVHCGSPDCTTGDVFAVPDSDGNVGGTTSLVLDAAGNPVVAYYDLTEDAIKVLRCGDENCAGGNTIQAVGPSSAYGLSLRLDSGGIPVVSYRDSFDNAVKIVRCGDAACSSGNSTASFDDGFVFDVSNLTLDSNDLPVIAYMKEPLDPELVMLRCGDTTCSSGNVTFGPPQNPTLAYAPLGLALDSSDNVILGYTHNGNTVVLHCSDATCSGPYTNQTIHPDPSSMTTLLLGASGNPVVVYGNVFDPAEALQIRCADPGCASVAMAPLAGLPMSSVLDTDDLLVGSYEGGFADLFLLRCHTIDCVQDFDDDGCSDAREQQLGVGSEKFGGRRDAKNPHDYFNPSGDGFNRVDDVLLVVQAYFEDDNDANPGLLPYAPGYNPGTDRTLVGPELWNLGPPNGLQRVDDILNQAKQYFHDCS